MISLILLILFGVVVGKFYTPQTQALLKNVIIKCEKEVNIERTLIIDFMNKKFSDDDVLKHFLFCSYLKLGFIKQDGTINKEAVINFGDNLIGDSKAASAACSNIQGGNGLESAYLFAKCYMDGLPKEEFAGVEL
nr:uncharacterized protein LOC111424978 [Onthophagus taurus]